jgi:hypothetical protein
LRFFKTHLPGLVALASRLERLFIRPRGVDALHTETEICECWHGYAPSP